MKAFVFDSLRTLKENLKNNNERGILFFPLDWFWMFRNLLNANRLTKWKVNGAELAKLVNSSNRVGPPVEEWYYRRSLQEDLSRM